MTANIFVYPWEFMDSWSNLGKTIELYGLQTNSTFSCKLASFW